MRVVLLVGALVAGCGRIGFDSVSGDFGGSNDGGLPPCTTAICQCDTDSDCPGPHMYCSAHAGEHTCDCVAGYGGSPCAWTGVVADPPIQNPSAWTTTGVIDPAMTQIGQLDPGLATLLALQRLSQTITMPRRSLAEPLVLEISYIGNIEDDCVTVDVPSADVGKHWIDLTARSFWTDSRSCLGAAMYAPEASSGAGVALPLQVMPTVSASAGIQIDHVEIVPASPNECVPPGPVPNGDCEADDSWTFTALPNGAPDGTSAGFVAGVGSGGSRAAQIFTPHPCELAEASVPFSVLPIEELPSPAIKFWFSATTGAAVSISAPGYAPLVGTGSPTTFEACLSPNQRGTTGGLLSSINASGTCANVINWTAALDDVAIVNEPGCGADPDLVDPGFESGLQPFGSFSIPGVSSVGVVANAALAHSGTDSLRIGTTTTCGVVEWTTTMFPPASTSGGGPALEFYYRAPANAQLSFVVRATSSAAPVVQDNTWRRGVVCFDPQLAGRSEPVTFELSGGSCGSTAEVDAYVDDLALVNDPTCPQ